MNGSEKALLEGRIGCVTFMLHLPGMAASSMLPWCMCEWSISMIHGVRANLDKWQR
jgi:hypothetical protein